MTEIFIYHQDWQELCSIDYNSNIIKRNNQEQGTIELKSYFLKIKWENYGEFDYFFSKDAVHYYQNSSSYSFHLLPQYILVRLFHKDNQKSGSILEKKYFIDKINQIAYDMTNYDLYYDYSMKDYVLKQVKHTLLTIYIHDNVYKYICFQDHDYIEYELYYENYEEVILHKNENDKKNQLKSNYKSKYVILDKMKKTYYINENIHKSCHLLLSEEGTFQKQNNYIQLIPFIKSQNLENEQSLIYKLNVFSFSNIEHNIYNRISIKDNNKIIENTNVAIKSFKDFQNIYHKLLKEFKQKSVVIPVYLFFNDAEILESSDTSSVSKKKEHRKELFLDIIYIIQYYQENKIPYILCDSYVNREKNKFFPDIQFYYYYFDTRESYLEFTEKIKQSYDNLILINDSFSYINQYIISKMNNNNKISMVHKNKEIISNTCIGKIPKNFHFIWIGNNQIPAIYIQYIQSWMTHHKEWNFYLWNDDNIPSLVNQSLFDHVSTFAQKADILRYEILYQYGGIYVDCDFLCIKNIEPLLNTIECIHGFSAYESNEYIAIGIMGFQQYDPFLDIIIKSIPYFYHTQIHKTIPMQTGPIFFTHMCNDFIINKNNVNELNNCNETNKYVKTNKFNKNIENELLLINKDNYHFFDKQYFYYYSFFDKQNKKPLLYHQNVYALHMWGHSWDLHKSFTHKIIETRELLELNQFVLKSEQSHHCQSLLPCEKNKNIENKQFIVSHKKRVIHIMGIYFSGGIEKYIYYFEKYGNHDKYEYILLCMKSYNHQTFDLYHHIKVYTFQNQYELNYLLGCLTPDLILDHYSPYLDVSPYVKETLMIHSHLYIIHSAIIYQKDISYSVIENCIHLYEEMSQKHDSWKNIKQNYICSLGTILKNHEYILDRIQKNNIKLTNINRQKEGFHISIIGRIVEEKIPICFLEKLSSFFQKINSNILEKRNNSNVVVHIYGEKAYFLQDNSYNNMFDMILQNNSNIIYHNYIKYDEIENIYEKTDLLLIPSIYETGSFTCLEAFAHGIPVIGRNNYGMKKLIEGGVSGYLCDHDEDIINKLHFCLFDDQSIFYQSYFIWKNSQQKYNICEKIKNMESIFDKHLPIENQDIIIITSVINISNSELSYYHTRSVFSLEERFQQTMETIHSIRKKMGVYIHILLCECSDLCLFPHIENEIKKNVDYYINCYSQDTVRNHVLSKFKGMGETYLMKVALQKIIESKITYRFIYKISGRYFINETFHLENFQNRFNIMTYWDGHIESYASIFYKIRFVYLDLFIQVLEKFDYDLLHGNSFEQCLYKFLNHNVMVLDNLGVSGLLATEGYKLSI